ncbi:flavin reductase (DIM6/NTAB) family NADH-FMN oxidoreductase RutF [Planifilum fimeticola]|jgi:flavin reductase (DIM6/NTAB) family NADH-FMN oxidoreductase RutF|uniref:Flavin reductase (DIM6/NTAB) family NADH-FMN oxidoreductase RutF n=1 Tax=Planifilum fimeticola TaxID=201975 RepID=A0A2T0LG78_9BACL|nr:flavin reductase family protein [Planifilum fimeticola]PRX41244.1 flavin reductase (DIM6/NTAB) family NADH-FMN oxidoreductase RutF [Planifilum fimeticola]
MDLRDYRNCLGSFATGVTVVTFNTDQGKHGFTANSFTSVSLDPPLVLVSVNRKIKSCAYMRDNSFAVNILRGNQQDLALHFAGKPQEGLEVRWKEGDFAPYLADALATIQCVPWKAYDGGDHVLYLGEVKHYQYDQGDALGFFRGNFFPISSDSGN